MAISEAQGEQGRLFEQVAGIAGLLMVVAAVIDGYLASTAPAESGRFLTDLFLSVATILALGVAWVLAAQGLRPAAAWTLVSAAAVRLILAMGFTASGAYAVLAPFYLIPIILAQLLLHQRAAVGVAAGSLLMFGLAYAAVSGHGHLGRDLPGVACLYLLLYLFVGGATQLLLARTTGAEARAERDSVKYERTRVQLQELQEQFRTLAESAAISIGIQQDGHLVYGNPRFAEMAGCLSDDVSGQSLWDFLTPGDMQALQRQLGNTAGAGRGSLASGEILLTPLKGESRWYGIAIAEAVYRERPALVASLLDVSERVAAKEDVQRERDFSNNIIDTAGAVIIALDAEGRVVRFNPAGEHLTGFSAEELRGLPYWTKVLPPERQQAAGAEFGEIISRGLDREAEAVWTTAGGEEVTIAWRWRYVLQIAPDAKVASVVGVGIDVTQQRFLERQASRTEGLRALGQIAGGVAHDLNNMLAGIMGPAELMLLDETDPNRQSDLNSIVRAAMRGAETVRRIQRFAQARTDLDRQVFDLRDLADDVIFTLRPRWRDAAVRQGIAIEVVNEAPAGLTVVASSGEIGNVLMNLIVNACEAMPQGGKATVWGERKGDVVEIRVSDTGIGMSEETKASIFKPFYSTKGAENSGLGLAVIHGIVLRHGGNISVSSELGVGTTFTVTLPATRPEPSQLTLESLGGAPMGKLRVLVVDDNTDIADFTAAVAKRLGHDSDAVYTGEEAVTRLESERYDALITDYGMEGVSGRGVADTARRLYPEIKTVLITGWDLSAEEREGFDSVLKKPFALAEVREVLEELAGE